MGLLLCVRLCCAFATHPLVLTLALLPGAVGNAFNILVNVTSVGLNGVIELVVPGLLFLYFTRQLHSQRLYISGFGWDVATWRRITVGVVALAVVLITAAYTLNVCAKVGVYGPLRKARHASEEEDYSHYAAYDDLAAPPAPIGVAAPVAAPTAAAAAGVVW